MSRRLLPLVVALPLLAACSQAVDTATKARDCAALARDVASVPLSQVPTREQAEQAARRLDERVEQLEDPQVSEAARTLRDRLREAAQAAGRADPAAARRAVGEVRTAAEQTAQACGVPVDQFVR